MNNSTSAEEKSETTTSERETSHVTRWISNEDAAFLLAIKLLKEKNLTAHVMNVARMIKITASTASKWSKNLEDREVSDEVQFQEKNVPQHYRSR